MISTILRYFANYTTVILPVSSCFNLKRYMYLIGGVNLEKNVSINGHTWIYGNGKIEIGRDTWIGPSCKIYTTINAMIKIGSNCDIAPNVVFISGTHKIGDSERRAGEGICKNIVIGKGVWIGACALILPGVTINDGAVIAAGSVVNKNVNKNTLVAGSPAKAIRDL